MYIESATVIPLRIPFTDGGSGTGLMPTRWTHLDMALLRLQTSDGVVGWGEGFSYASLATTVSAIREMVLPLVVNQTIDAPAVFNQQLQQKLHLHGRYGITQFALAAVDMALWDIAAKQAGKPLARYITDSDATGGQPRESLPAYASLVRYGDPALVSRFTSQAVAQGYQTIKLHEITLPTIKAGRDAAPLPIRLITDINCNWTDQQAHELMPAMRELGLYWVEEPLFPPDDAVRLANLQKQYGVSMASGENACTSVEFARLVPAIDFIQPSVTKVGGISEFLKVCDLAVAGSKQVMPHSPYFGPGYWASAQIMAARPVCTLFEHLYIQAEAYLDPSIPLPIGGQVAVPAGPGLGFEPDPQLLARYAA